MRQREFFERVYKAVDAWDEDGTQDNEVEFEPGDTWFPGSRLKFKVWENVTQKKVGCVGTMEEILRILEEGYFMPIVPEGGEYVEASTILSK